MVAEWRSTAWKVGTSRSRTVAADRSESVIVPAPMAGGHAVALLAGP
jgi:hypothetical protein